MYKTLFRSIAVNVSTLSITDDEIDTNSIIDVYTDNNAIYASGISVIGHTLSITFDGTLSGANVAVVVNNIDGSLLIPSKTSDLVNDSGFITDADVPTKTSDLENDSGFITIEDVPSAQDEYKTVEHVVGKWIDGRNVYAFTFDYTFSNLTSGTTTIRSFTEDVTLLKYECMIRNNDTNAQYTMPYSNGSSTSVLIMNNKRDLCARVNNDSWGSKFSPFKITVFYLKDSEVI